MRTTTLTLSRSILETAIQQTPVEWIQAAPIILTAATAAMVVAIVAETEGIAAVVETAVVVTAVVVTVVAAVVAVAAAAAEAVGVRVGSDLSRHLTQRDLAGGLTGRTLSLIRRGRC